MAGKKPNRVPPHYSLVGRRIATASPMYLILSTKQCVSLDHNGLLIYNNVLVTPPPPFLTFEGHNDFSYASIIY